MYAPVSLFLCLSPRCFPLQVPDECDVRGAESVVQRGWIPDAPQAGHHSAQQGETVGQGEREMGERRRLCVCTCIHVAG